MKELKKEAAKATPNVEGSQLKEYYNQLKDCSENGKDCTDILQKIINFSCENVISEAELLYHLP